MVRTRFLRVTASIALVCVGCSPSSSPVTSLTEMVSNDLCVEARGTWQQDSRTCTLTGTNAHGITVKVSGQYPLDLVENPTAGPPLRAFIKKFYTRFANPDDGLVHDGSADLTYHIYENGPDVKSIVLETAWFLGGAHPNNK